MSRVHLPRPLVGASLLFLTVLAATCGRGPTAPVDTDTFVDAVVALRVAAARAEAPDDFVRRRPEILAELGVAEEDLRAYVEAWAHHPAHMAGVWTAVRDALRRETVLEGQADPADELMDSDGLPELLHEPPDTEVPDRQGRRDKLLPSPAAGRIR
jgi:hypothetical protein